MVGWVWVGFFGWRTMDDQVIWGWICLNLDLQELSEPGFSGFLDFQDWGLVYRMFFANKKHQFLIGSLESQTHNPMNSGSD